MCLYINFKETEKLRKQGGKVKVYKLYKYNDCYPNRPSYIYEPGYPVISKEGIIKSNRKSIELTSDESYVREIDIGIHVFLNKEDAISFMEKDRFIMTVNAPIKNLVAVGTYDGYPSAVFTEIKVNKKSMLASFKRTKAIILEYKF